MKDRLYIVTMTVAVWAKNEEKAKDKVETQLGFSDHSDYGCPEVEPLDPNTKIISIVQKP